MTDPSPTPPLVPRRVIILRMLGLVAAIALSLTIFLLRDQLPQLRSLGYLGVFLITLLANATLILPVPGVMFTSLMGAINSPILTALVAASGAALGELTGYLAGLAGRTVFERTSFAGRIAGMVEKYGGWGVFILALIPNPFFDLAGIAAGSLRIPVRRFLLFCWAGSLGKMLLFALLGRFLGDRFLP